MTFSEWFAQRYPKLREAMEFGMLSGNELWLYTYSKEAFEAGQQNPIENENGDQSPLGTEQDDS